MLNFIDAINQEYEWLQRVMKKLDEMAGEPGKPGGAGAELRLVEEYGRATYYKRWRIKKEDGKWGYKTEILRDMDEVAAMKAERQYRELRKRVQSNLRYIEKLKKYYLPYDCQAIDDALPKAYQSIDGLSIVPEQERVDTEVWADEAYRVNALDIKVPQRSMSGKVFRSKSEALIADALEFYNIHYRSDERLDLMDAKRVLHQRYPDFIIMLPSGTEIYWEHLGLLAKDEYAERAAEKLCLYFQNGILPGKNLILTADDSSGGIDMRIVKSSIERWLEPHFA